uniref:NADH-ubiquinone oxidoreductase chain 2 n=1 Tax=Scolytinae sp. BMNH 1274299 TaxID=2558041 RepID=A0A126TE08_9CUCU|nr:NADH dehydrogenase subunit 2 [Scolytinae sp. BMNH 1274299]
MTKFFKLLFSSTLIAGSIMSISSLSWLHSWIGLEINLLSFLPLMKTSDNKYSSESMSKYFMSQAMASFILLFSAILFTNYESFEFEMTSVPSIFMSMAIMMKMGAAPLHFWLPEVASGISWNSNLILFTWQKIAPMIILSYLIFIPNLMILFILASSIIGSILGINQTCMRKILAYSSINHISWMLASMMCSMNTWLVYFLIYTILNLTIISSLKMWKIFFIPQISKIKNNSEKFMFMLNFFSLGGLPPFPGFIPKWMTISQLSNNHLFSIMTIMILFTLLTLYFYLRITFSSMLMYMNNSMIMKSKNNTFMNVTLLTTMPTILMFSILII